jgi:hypothetical protein
LLLALVRWVLPLLLFALPLAFAHSRFCPSGPFDILVDMKVDGEDSRPGLAELWINDTAGQPLQQSYLPGVRQTLHFQLKNCGTISYLRLDPTNRAGSSMRLYGIRVTRDGQELRHFSPRDLGGWRNNCEESAAHDDSLFLRARHEDPQIDAHFPNITSPLAGPAWLRSLWNRLADGDSRAQRTRLLALAVLTVAGLGLLHAGGRLQAAVLAISVPLTYYLLGWLHAVGGRPPGVRNAVGFVSYFGFPTSLERLKLALLICIPASAALACVLLLPRWLGASSPPAAPLSPPAPRRRRVGGVAVLALLVLGLACYFYPDLEAIGASLTSPQEQQWDANNLTLWRHLVQTGARPSRDFWYPYAGFALFSLPFPHGELVAACHSFAFFTVFLLAVYLNTEKSVPATLCIFLATLALSAQGFFSDPERYGLVVNVVLTYAAIDQSSARVQWRHALFWFAVLQAGVFEPTSVIYAGIPLAASIALDVLHKSISSLSAFARRLCRDFAAPAVAFLVIGVWLAARGQLLGFLQFMTSLGVHCDYCALPVDLPNWLKWGSPAESFALWSVVVLTGLGLGRLLVRPGVPQKAARLLFMLGLTTAALMLKQFVRPHMATQILFVGTTGALFYLFGSYQSFNAFQRGGVYLVAGILLANFAESRAPQLLCSRLESAATRVRSSAAALALRRPERRDLVEARFAPDRYRLTEGQRAVYRALRDALPVAGPRRIFVLADDPILYILCRLRPYWHTNFYSAAPLGEQRKMVGQLEADPPLLVVWKPCDPGIDAVPPVVRVPLVFDYVIRNYVPAATVNEYELLRRRGPGEAVAIDFWRERLGSTLHLGHIPRLSHAADFAEPTGAPGEEVVPLLHVHITDPQALTPSRPLPQGFPTGGLPAAPARALSVPVDCDGRRFTLTFDVTPGCTDYQVALDRVWFWGPLQRSGCTPAIGGQPAGAAVQVVPRVACTDVLY